MVRSLLLVLGTALIASCGGGDGSTQDGGPAGFAPTMSVNGTKVGIQPVNVMVDENTTDVAVVASTGGTLSVSADNDGSLFTLAADGQLSFIDAPDFENPGGDGSNSYTVRVDATADISAAVTLTVQVKDVAEGSVIDGRVVDGPVKAADVYADMNCNAMQDENEKPFAETDDDGFFQIQTDAELTDGCNGKFFSIGGTDTVTNKALADTDTDGIGNNADTDDDGDGVADTADAFPLNKDESVDTDGDGIGNNADTDDDGDGILDAADPDPLAPSSFVLKGPLHKATVFYDFNDNGELDEGEPSTTTGTDGSYSLAKGQNAPEAFSVVVQMGPATVDYGSGESYAAASVGLKGALPTSKGGVISPMTTLHEHSKGESDGAISPADLSKALGLPASVDILTFNSHAAGVDKALAHEVETIAQHLMTMKLLVAETIVGSSVSGAKSMTDGLAEEIALDALVKLLVEVASNQAGGDAGTVSIEGALDITNAEHLEELEKLIEADLKGGTFGAELTAQDATVPFEVFEYTIEHSSDLINKVASEFDKLGADDFGSIRAHGVSHLKHEAAEQILALAKAVRSHFDAKAEVTSFSMQGFLALADAAAFNLALEEGYTLVRKHIIAINGYTDTDNDGFPDTCDAGCLATGLTADHRR